MECKILLQAAILDTSCGIFDGVHNSSLFLICTAHKDKEKRMGNTCKITCVVHPQMVLHPDLPMVANWRYKYVRVTAPQEISL